MSKDHTFTWEIRDAAMQCADQPLRERLFDAANALATSIKKFALVPTAEHLITVNGNWALAQRLLDIYDGVRDDDPTGGKGKPTTLSLPDLSVNSIDPSELERKVA